MNFQIPVVGCVGDCKKGKETETERKRRKRHNQIISETNFDSIKRPRGSINFDYMKRLLDSRKNTVVDMGTYKGNQRDKTKTIIIKNKPNVLDILDKGSLVKSKPHPPEYYKYREYMDKKRKTGECLFDYAKVETQCVPRKPFRLTIQSVDLLDSGETRIDDVNINRMYIDRGVNPNKLGLLKGILNIKPSKSNKSNKSNKPSIESLCSYNRLALKDYSRGQFFDWFDTIIKRRNCPGTSEKEILAAMKREELSNTEGSSEAEVTENEVTESDEIPEVAKSEKSDSVQPTVKKDYTMVYAALVALFMICVTMLLVALIRK
jgi:hypothetical protein